MWIDRVLKSPTRGAIELTAKFAEQRHKVLVENVANIDTPQFRSKILDPVPFQAALRSALESASGDRKHAASTGELNLRDGEQFSTDANGNLLVTPSVEPAQNVEFHDGSNARLESLMTDVQDNAMTYDLAVNLLRNRFDTLITAIKGRST